jgi:hypothetical protein
MFKAVILMTEIMWTMTILLRDSLDDDNNNERRGWND